MGDPRSRCPAKCPRLDYEIDSPRLRGKGPKSAKIMIVGEVPGQEEDVEGVPFVGNAGKLLNEALQDAGIRKSRVYVTNSVKCATPIENKKPGKKEINCCRSYLEREIKTVNPNVIIALGATALEAVLKRTGITKLQNNVFVSAEFGIKVVPVIHPAYVLRNPAAYDSLLKGLALARQESVKKERVETATLKTKHFDADTDKKISKVFSALEKSKVVIFDLETTSLNPQEAKILCVALSWKMGLGVTIRWSALQGKFLPRLKDLMRSKQLKVGHNIKYDAQVFRANGVQVRGPFFDTLTAYALINENAKDKSLDALTLRYLDLGEYWTPLNEWRDEYLKGNKELHKEDFTYDLFPYDLLAMYAQCDADATYRLFIRFRKELKRQNLMHFYRKYTIPTLKILMKMEYKGIQVNRDRLKELIEEYKIRITESRTKIATNKTVRKYEKIRYARISKQLEAKWETSKILRSRFPDSKDYILARVKEKDWQFNPRSTLQLRELLFDLLKLPSDKKTDTGLPSTDESVMIQLAEQYEVPITQDILENRRLTKFLSTYLESVYAKSAYDGRIHPSYLQHRAVTGRLSSANPNFQNIPRDAKEFKKCFLADPGYIIVKADLAQAEFRCWAHYSNDQKMIADIEAGLDIHRHIASVVFGIPEDEVTKDQRTAAKNCVFGLMYGRGSKAIAAQYGISETAANEVRDIFFDSYPAAARWLDKQVAHARTHHYVKTWMGRVRRLPEIVSDDHMARAEAERQAKNSPIQGLASDMNNHYMVINTREARRSEIKCFPMATVHDANFIQVKKSHAKRLMKLMNRVVDSAFPDFKCRMALDFEVGKTLGTLKEIEVPRG